MATTRRPPTAHPSVRCCASWACLGLAGLFLAFGSPQARSASSHLSATIERIKPAIVAVGTYQKTRNPPFIFRGTGFAVGNGTLVATNAHVIPAQLATDQRETLVVITAVGGSAQPREVTQVANSAAHDLALLRVTGAALPAQPWATNASCSEMADIRRVQISSESAAFDVPW